MADKKLEIPPALYDYVLYYECAQKDWKNYNLKLKIKGDGSMMDAINWNSTYSFHPNDSGGNTLFGVIETTWQSYAKSHGLSQNLNDMGKSGWLGVVKNIWDISCAPESANYACAFLLFQTVWGGFNTTVQEKLLNTLKEKADKKDYPFIKSGGRYKKIADATNAYNDPMVPFGIIRNSLLTYYYNISQPGTKNSVFRVGWFNRVALPFTPYGFFVATTASGKSLGMTDRSTVADWDAAIATFIQNGAKGLVKIFDWGASPESIQNMMASIGSCDFSSAGGDGSSGGSSGAYGGCGGVTQLGNYTNAPDAQITFQQTQNRDEVLNTLVGGSYTPNDIKKCDELITSEKKKSKKTKSES